MRQAELKAQQEKRKNASLNCKLASWSSWGECKSEDSGTFRSWFRDRTRKIINPQLPGGIPCPATIQREQCKHQGKAYSALKDIINSIWG